MASASAGSGVRDMVAVVREEVEREEVEREEVEKEKVEREEVEREEVEKEEVEREEGEREEVEKEEVEREEVEREDVERLTNQKQTSNRTPLGKPFAVACVLTRMRCRMVVLVSRAGSNATLTKETQRRKRNSNADYSFRKIRSAKVLGVSRAKILVAIMARPETNRVFSMLMAKKAGTILCRNLAENLWDTRRHLKSQSSMETKQLWAFVYSVRPRLVGARTPTKVGTLYVWMAARKAVERKNAYKKVSSKRINF